jgi:group I intron endonuclease
VLKPTRAGVCDTSDLWYIGGRGEAMGIIYKITNLANGKVYIGQTTRTLKIRIKAHHNETASLTRYRGYPIHCAIRKYGKENFVYETIEECETQDDLNVREVYWIEYYNSRDNKYGYNLKEGGARGKAHPSTCKKIGDAHRGRKRSPEMCEKLRRANWGKKASSETKIKMALAKMGAGSPNYKEIDLDAVIALLNTNMTIRRICKEIGIHFTNLNPKFFAAYGMSMGEYREKVLGIYKWSVCRSYHNLDQAQFEELLCSSLTIAEVAKQLGMGTVSLYKRCDMFYNKTPAVLRAELLNR